MVRWLVASLALLSPPTASAAVPNICSTLPDSVVTATLGGKIVSRFTYGNAEIGMQLAPEPFATVRVND